MDKRSFPDKYYKKIKDLPFLDEIESKSTDDIKKEIVKCEERIFAIEKAQEEDAALLAAKEDVKNLSSAYRDVKAVETAKIKYILFLLESRGVELESNENRED